MPQIMSGLCKNPILEKVLSRDVGDLSCHGVSFERVSSMENYGQ
jgi:hypothetical protein